MWAKRTAHSMQRDDAQYRRGAALGLTFGEIFLLLAFVLLLMLGLFQVRRADETRNSELIPRPEAAQMRKQAAQLAPTRDALQSTRAEVSGLNDKLDELDSELRVARAERDAARRTLTTDQTDLNQVVEQAEILRSDVDRLRASHGALQETNASLDRQLTEVSDELNGLRDGQAALQHERDSLLSELEEKRLMVEELASRLQRLVDENVALRKDFNQENDYTASMALASDKDITPEAVEALIEALEPSDYVDMEFMASDLRNGRAIRDMHPTATPEEIAAAVDQANRIGPVADALDDAMGKGLSPDALGDFLSLSPDKQDLAMSIAKTTEEPALARIKQALESGSDLVEDVTGAVERELGGLIRSVDGTIDPETGSISVPHEVLFDIQSADLTARTRAFLDGFCAPWIETVRGFGDRIRQMQIEGHSSSEWGGDPPETAYFKNLDLSQRRSAAVLQYCLGHDLSPETAAWARKVLVAVGLSSSRPVMHDGSEDAERSRRVVFGFDIDKGKIIDDIKRNLDTPGEQETTAAELPTPKQSFPQAQYGGPARILTNASLKIGGAVLTLEGLDALPADAVCVADGRSWPCGRIAAMNVAGLMGANKILCTPANPDRPVTGPIPAHCEVDGRDVSEFLLTEGWASPLPEAPEPYRILHAEAQARGVGLWKTADLGN